MFNQALLQEPMFTVATPVLSLSENKTSSHNDCKIQTKKGRGGIQVSGVDKLGPVELLGNVS
jgi:hypothetical protein